MTVLRKIARDLLDGKLPAIAAKDLAVERLKICEQCSQYKPMSHQCDVCNCFMDLKTKLLEAECPIGLW